MYNLTTVQTKARETAEYRGHVLGTFKKVSARYAVAECMRCNQQAIATLDDGLNDIQGNAVEVNCG